MKKVLFATTATAALAIGGMASAQGISLFGDARLGLGYNINNSGGVDLDPVFDDDGVLVGIETGDDLRAVSRVRFGVNMTGETDSGISFGASIRADNSSGGNNDFGQTAGDVFASGDWGTLTFGDTNGADEQHVGDAGGNLSLTGLGDFNETPFISNGGGFGDNSVQVFNNAEARPTVRYDYDIAGFGLSVSTGRNLNDIVVGAGYSLEYGGGSFNIGLGYNDFAAFTTDPTISGSVFVPGVEVRGGEQFSGGLSGDWEMFNAGVVYTSADVTGSGSFDWISANLGAGWNEFGVSVYYSKVLDAEGDGNDSLDVLDGRDSYGVSAAYDLGGGASINAGIAQTYGRDSRADDLDTEDDETIFELDSATVADFGIKMSF